MPEGPSIRWLRKHNATNCPIASYDNKTALYNPKLMKVVVRCVDNHIINTKASKDADFKPRYFIVKLYFMILYRFRRLLGK